MLIYRGAFFILFCISILNLNAQLNTVSQTYCFTTYFGLNINLPLGEVDMPIYIPWSPTSDPSLAGFSYVPSASGQVGFVGEWWFNRVKTISLQTGFDIYDRKERLDITRTPLNGRDSFQGETRRINHFYTLDIPVYLGYRFKKWQVASGVRISLVTRWKSIRYKDDTIIESLSGGFAFPWRDIPFHPAARVSYSIIGKRTWVLAPWLGVERRIAPDVEVRWWDFEMGMCLSLF